MIRVLLLVSALQFSPETSFALDKKVTTLMSDMNCVVYQLTDSQPSRKLVGALRVWAIINEGPKSVVIWASNGDRVALVKPYTPNEGVVLFTGDRRYNYSVSLASKGSALVHACR
jgi:hypothetical protein